MMMETFINTISFLEACKKCLVCLHVLWSCECIYSFMGQIIGSRYAYPGRWQGQAESLLRMAAEFEISDWHQSEFGLISVQTNDADWYQSWQLMNRFHHISVHVSSKLPWRDGEFVRSIAVEGFEKIVMSRWIHFEEKWREGQRKESETIEKIQKIGRLQC